MEERKIGVIPNLVVQGAMGPKEYGVLLTSERSIFVLERASKAGVGAVLGGVVGAALAEAATSRRSVDFENADPGALAGEPKNIAIRHSAIERVEMKKSWGSYRLRIEYANPEGKHKKLQAMVTPPAQYVKARKREGVKAKAAADEYARKVRDAFREAFSPGAAARAEWRF